MDPEALKAYATKVAPLGELRCRILDCLRAYDPAAPCHFMPKPEEDLKSQFKAHVEKWWDEHADDLDSSAWVARSLFAAGLLSFGRMEMVDHLLDNLPPKPIFLTDGGWCLVMGHRALLLLLPLPQEFADSSKLYQGSDENARLREWLGENRKRLVWDRTAERFRLESAQ